MALDKCEPGPRKRATGKIRLRAGWLIDGLGGPVLRDRLVEVEGGRITAIHPFRQANPSMGEVVDLSHATLLPPLIDAHVHLSFPGSPMPPGQDPACDTAGDIVADSLVRHWNNGVLAVRDAGDNRGTAWRFKSTRLADWPLPQILRSPGWAWHAPGRYGRLLGRALSRERDLDEALTGWGDDLDHIKLVNSGMNSLEQFGRQTEPQFDQDRLTAIRAAAVNKHLPLMVHANGAAPVASALAGGCDSIEHGYFMGEDNLGRMADEQVFWVPTVVPMAALAEGAQVPPGRREVARRTRDHQLNCIAKAYAMGVQIVAGTDSGSPGVVHGVSVWQELHWLRQAGLSPAAAVACATSRAAALLRLTGRGVLARNLPADFLVIGGEPEKGIGDAEKLTGMCVGGTWWGEPDICASIKAGFL